MSKRKPIVRTSALDAYYGDDSDGAYHQVAKCRKGWYVTVWVEGAWTGDIATDKGPWKTEQKALNWGRGKSAGMVPGGDAREMAFRRSRKRNFATIPCKRSDCQSSLQTDQ
jgi:hypothetical protein